VYVEDRVNGLLYSLPLSLHARKAREAARSAPAALLLSSTSSVSMLICGIVIPDKIVYLVRQSLKRTIALRGSAIAAGYAAAAADSGNAKIWQEVGGRGMCMCIQL
jgi:hypothetical protein